MRISKCASSSRKTPLSSSRTSWRPHGSHLASQEDRVRQFKVQHVGKCPGSCRSQSSDSEGLQSQLQTEQDHLNAAQQQRVYLQTLADQYRTSGPVKSSDGVAVGLPALEQELEKLRAQLADLSSHYTDRHPDVRKLKEQIAKTEKVRDQLTGKHEEQANVKTRTRSGDGSSGQQTDATLNPASAQLESQLRSNQLEITNREHSIAALKAKIDDYQARLNQEPIREQQLADLTRGYEQSKANYDDLLKKKNESTMATSMEIAAARRTVSRRRSSQLAAEALLSQPTQVLRHRAGSWPGTGRIRGRAYWK